MRLDYVLKYIDHSKFNIEHKWKGLLIGLQRESSL